MTDGLTGSSLIGSADVRPDGGTFRAIDPATGAELDPAYGEAGPAEVGPGGGPGRGGLPGLSADHRRAAGGVPGQHRRQHRGARLDPGRARHRRDRPARGPGGRRDRPYGRPAAAVRLRGPRRRLARRPRRHPAARPHPAAPPGSAAARRPGRTGGGVRGEQLPARVLRRRWRHRLRAGRRLPGGRQGPPGPSGHVRAGRTRHSRRRGRARPAGGHLLPAAGHHPRAGHGAGHRPAHPGRRLHRLASRRPRAGRGGSEATRTDSGLCRDVLGQPGVPAAGGAGGAGGRDGIGVRDVGDRLGRTAVHPARAGLRPGERRPEYVRRRGRPEDRGRRRHPDAHLRDGGRASIRRRGDRRHRLG